jgi:site-specific recombinase XerD
MLDHMELDTLSGLRDRAILLLGFAGGFRRSELVALDVDDLVETAQGLRVRIRRSKTDQEGVGREVGIPFGRHVDTCPVKAWRAWQSAAGLLKGPCFRPMNSRGGVRDRRLTAQSVALIVKAAAVTAGLEPTSYAGHSLRSGLATAAAAGGASERSIMDQTGHKSLPVVRRYIRRGSLFQDNAASHTDL